MLTQQQPSGYGILPEEEENILKQQETKRLSPKSQQDTFCESKEPKQGIYGKTRNKRKPKSKFINSDI